MNITTTRLTNILLIWDKLIGIEKSALYRASMYQTPVPANITGLAEILIEPDRRIHPETANVIICLQEREFPKEET